MTRATFVRYFSLICTVQHFMTVEKWKTSSAYAIIHIRYELLIVGLFNVGQLGRIIRGHKALISDQRGTLVGHLIALKADLMLGVARHHHGHELGAEAALGRVAARVLVHVLERAGHHALVGRQKVRVRVATEVLDSALPWVLGHQVRKYPANTCHAKLPRNLVDFLLAGVWQNQFTVVLGHSLWRFIDRRNHCLYAERNSIKGFIVSVQKSDALVATSSPVVQKLVNHLTVLKHNVIYMPKCLREIRFSMIYCQTDIWQVFLTTEQF